MKHQFLVSSCELRLTKILLNCFGFHFKKKEKKDVCDEIGGKAFYIIDMFFYIFFLAVKKSVYALDSILVVKNVSAMEIGITTRIINNVKLPN